MAQGIHEPGPFSGRDRAENLLAFGLGCFLGLGLLKFGTPVILESRVPTPSGLSEILHQGWPFHWGYAALAILLSLAFWSQSGRWRARPFLIALLAIWLGWQFISASFTVDSALTRSVLKHFVACVACFIVAYIGCARSRSSLFLWIPIALAFVWVIRLGVEQRFGGLEQTRKYFQVYVLPNSPDLPPDYIKRMSSSRIFSSLFYPNALAGVILLLLPPLLVSLWHLLSMTKVFLRQVLCGAILAGALACLYWSGSKSGWLILLVLAAVVFSRLAVSRRVKASVIGALIVLGLAGFFMRYAGFFERGATSVSARFDYWRGAILTLGAHPLVGTGPGTFAIPYGKIKSSGAEMTRLCHNDYLEQGSDSGFIGFLAYTGFILGSFVFLYRKRPPNDDFSFALALGCLGLALHSFVEFHLYVPSLAWTFFAFLGLLLSEAKPIDISPPRK